MREKIYSILNHPFVKALLLGASTLSIGGVCSAMGQWDFEKDDSLKGKIFVLIVLSIVYIVLLAYYSTNETNEKKIALIYEKQNQAFEEVMSGMMGVCKNTAEGANKVIKSIINDRKANLELWSFNEACFWVCRNVYDLLCKLGTGKDFEVIYDRLDESEKPETKIYANAYANKDSKRPSLYGKKRSIQNDIYRDAELFRLNQSDVDVIVGSEKIDEFFEHVSKAKRNKNKKKYNQYIAIPIFCNDKKMVGLFEIVCLNKTYLGETEEEIREIVSKYFMTYAFFVLVLHKLEKALIAKPQ
ncbi:MAG: hypothetical protein V8Q86_09990 [Blautia sp.]